MNTKFTCGADVTHDGKGKAYVTDCMGLFETVEQAVAQRKALHQSFPYLIIEVEDRVVRGLKRSSGLRNGSPCSGYPIVRSVCHAFNHPTWRD